MKVGDLVRWSRDGKRSRLCIVKRKVSKNIGEFTVWNAYFIDNGSTYQVIESECEVL